MQQPHQVVGRSLAVPRETAQIAKQHRNFGLARGQHHLGVDAFDASSTTGEKNWLSPARCRSSSRTSRSELSVAAASSVNFRSSRKSVGSDDSCGVTGRR